MHKTEIIANGFSRDYLVRFACDIVGSMIRFNDCGTVLEVEGCYVGKISDITTSMRCGGIIVRIENDRYEGFNIGDMYKISIFSSDNCISCENVKKVILTMEHGETICFKYKTHNYNDYIKSDKWKDKRRLKLKESNYKCQLCNASNTELHVHHNTYENLGYEPMKDLIVLCKECHEKLHDVKNDNEDAGQD